MEVDTLLFDMQKYTVDINFQLNIRTLKISNIFTSKAAGCQ